MLKSEFFYALPPRLIAQRPLPERSESRLLCLDGRTSTLEDRQFSELVDFLEPGDLLVFNDTKVIPARLFGTKTSGGKVEILIERLLKEGEALVQIRASKAPKPGAVIQLEGGACCEVCQREDGFYRLRFPPGETVESLLQRIGHIPLPPYIDRCDEPLDINRYQTVYARRPGAVAAPTAGLHFDHTFIQSLESQGIASAYVTLHVGSGTFQPLRVENLDDHIMHSEFVEVSEVVVEQVARARRVVAVGTTVARALESAACSGSLQPFRGETDLFIRPGFQFRCIDALVTNFHLPESTLLTLVCAFGGYDAVMAAYRHAVVREYRFFSYGDAMFLTRQAGGG